MCVITNALDLAARWNIIIVDVGLLFKEKPASPLLAEGPGDKRNCWLFLAPRLGRGAFWFIFLAWLWLLAR